MKSIYNVPLVRTQTSTALTNIGNLLDVQITGAQNNDILVYNAPKWENKPQVLNNNTDVTINAPINNQFLGHNGTEWINKEIALNDLSDVALTSLSVNQILQWDGDFWSNYTLPSANAFANLSDVTITGVQNNDSIIFDANTAKYVNKKKYAEYDNYVNVTNGTVTAVARTVYFCNLATINLPASTLGEQIKVINTNGSTCTIAYTEIIYHLVNNFNTSYTTVDACEMTLEGILGGNWQIISFTGRWNNNTTNKRLSNNNLEDLRNMSILLPTNGQYLTFNGTNWVNTNLPAETVYFKKYTSYIKLTNQTVSLTNNTLYQSANSTINVGVSPAGTVFSVVNTSGTTTLNFDANQYLLVFNSFELGAFTLSTSEKTNINITCFSSDGFSSYYIIESSSGDWDFSLSTKKIGAYVDINTLKNVNISGPVSGQFLTYNGTEWTNTSLERCHPTSEIYCFGNGTSATTTLTTQNVWYQFAHATTLNNNPSANGVFSLTNANLFSWTYTGTNSKYFHSAISISASTNDAGDTYQVAYFINGVIVPGSIFVIDYANNNQAHGTAFHKVLLLNTNDVIDVRMRNISANGKVITVNNLNGCNLACCSLT